MSQLIKETLLALELAQSGETLPDYRPKTDLGLALGCMFYVLVKLADRKQQDYGSRNLTDFGPYGVLVRLSDKRARLQQLMDTVRRGGQAAVKEETLADTWADLANYGAIGFLMESGLWPFAGTATLESAARMTAHLGALKAPVENTILETLRVSTTPFLEGVQRVIDSTSSLEITLLSRETEKLVKDLAHVTRSGLTVPMTGRTYGHQRIGYQVRVLAVSMSQEGEGEEFVSFQHIDEGSASEPYLRTERLSWWNENYKNLPEDGGHVVS